MPAFVIDPVMWTREWVSDVGFVTTWRWVFGNITIYVDDCEPKHNVTITTKTFPTLVPIVRTTKMSLDSINELLQTAERKVNNA